MRRLAAVICLFASLYGPIVRDAQATVLDDVNDTLTKLNPITGAISSLIGQAKDAGNSVLQQRLEQLNGIIQLAIQQLNEAAKERIADLDEKATKQIAQLNTYVQNNLLQFDYLVHHNLADADTFLSARINQFNEGVANTICSISLLKTSPILRTGDTGITTFKQVGDYTSLYIPGSCLAKYSSAPDAYLTGDTIAESWKNWWKGIKLDNVNASSALIQVRLPNTLVPDKSEPSEFVLHLKLSMGSFLGFSSYSDQAVPLHICGVVPRLTAHLRADAIGKAHNRKTVPYPSTYPGIIVNNGISLAHSSTPGGNGNDPVEFPVPGSPEAGWDVDMSAPDYGLVWAINAQHGHVAYNRRADHGLHIYTDGSEGDAWLNVALSVKLIQTVSKDPCATPVEWDVPIAYGPMNAIDIHDKIQLAIGPDCQEASNEMLPAVTTRVEVFDASHRSYGSDFLKQNVPAEFLHSTLKITMDNQNHLTTAASPYCDSSAVPVTK